MPPRRSVDLDVPGVPPLARPANVLDFFAPPQLGSVVSPIAVLDLALRQKRHAAEKAIARHERRKERRQIGSGKDDRGGAR
jgi:hypothetical protein